jgi:hypothetical protein
LVDGEAPAAQRWMNLAALVALGFVIVLTILVYN